MIDINIIRTNRSLVENNLKKKYQEEKLPLIDKILSLDTEVRELKTKGDNLRQERNKKSDEIGLLYREKKTTEAESIKEEVKKINDSLVSLEEKEENLSKELKELMMTIPNIIADDVPIGKDDSFNVEEQRFGEPIVPDYAIPYHSDIMATFNGLDKESAGRVSGNGFYYLMGDMARLHYCHMLETL